MAVPMIQRDCKGWLRRNRPPINFPPIAVMSKDKEKAQINEELQSTSCRFRERPTVTKKIGVKRWTMGVILLSMVSAKEGSACRSVPKGRKKRLDRARPAAKPPSNSGAPTV